MSSSNLVDTSIEEIEEFSCNNCNNTFKLRRGLMMHMRKNHNQQGSNGSLEGSAMDFADDLIRICKKIDAKKEAEKELKKLGEVEVAKPEEEQFGGGELSQEEDEHYRSSQHCGVDMVIESEEAPAEKEVENKEDEVKEDEQELEKLGEVEIAKTEEEELGGGELSQEEDEDDRSGQCKRCGVDMVIESELKKHMLFRYSNYHHSNLS